MNSLLGYSDVWLIGGGGKTTLMFRLAKAWAEQGESVLCTTTTRIFPPSPDLCADLRLSPFEQLVVDLQRRPARLATAARCVEGGKCLGFTAEEALALKAHAGRLLVEADGSAGRPVKAHAPHEPVVAAGATCVVAVVGAWCVGTPLDSEHVPRPERFGALAGLAMGAAVTADAVARVILHTDGWLSAAPAGAAFHVVVTGEDRGIARALAEHPNAGRVVATLGV